MNTSDHAYDYDGLDYTYLETQQFTDFVVTVKRAIRTMTRQNKKMKVPHGDKKRPYGATVSDMKQVLGNVPADWLFSALRNLEGEGSVYQFQSGAMTRWACKAIPVEKKREYNGKPIPPSVKRPDAEVFEDRHRVTA